MNNINKIYGTVIALAALALPGQMSAQKAGDLISGIVEDDFGPMMAVNVTERDAADRIINHAVTDMNGEFSFRLVNPKDRIQISYVGLETVDIPIDKTYFEIKMKEAGDLPEVEITAQAVSNTEGLPIPMREMPSARQTLDMTELEGLGITTVDEALAGRFSGLDIAFTSGDLGARSTMHLRGVSTMTGDQNPLIVVDGMIWEIDSNLKNNFDYQNESQNTEKVSELLNINPEDIATITVLKDAAATAIWGSRGANGVMEIKTKRGARGQTRVNYSYRMNGTWQPEGYKLLNGDQYTMYLKEAFFNPELKDAAADIDEINYDDMFSEYEMFNDNTDWVDAVKQFGVQHSHNLSVSGGGDKANFRISAGFDNQQGSVIGQKMNRFTTRVAFDYFVSDRIKVTTNFSMTYSKNKQNSAAISTAMKMMPNLAIYYEDPLTGVSTGEFYHMRADASDALPKNTNPVAEAAEKQQFSTSLNVSPDFSLTYNLLGIEDDQHKLTYEGRVNFGVTNSGSDNYTPVTLSREGWKDGNANSVSSNSSKSSQITTNHSLTFIPHLKNPNHSFMAMVRYQLSNSYNKGQNASISGLPSGTFQSIGLDGKIGNISTSASQNRSMNVTFTAHYSYKSKYSFDVTTRSDGSTRFGDAKRWGTFPAFSGRWNISDEKWFDALRNTGLLTMMATRVSWGLQGNAPGGDGMFYSKYSSGTAYLGTSTIYPSNIRLSNLQWEETVSWNLGFDFGLFKDRLSANIDLYTRTTEKMLNQGYAIPTSSGFSSLDVVNEGSMKNAGWEFSLSANRIYETKILGKQFSVNGNINFADNTNQILEMNPTMLAKMNKDFDFNNGSYLSYVALKNSFGSIYGFKYLGVYQYSDYSEVEIPGVSGPNAPVVKDENGVAVKDKNGQYKPVMFAYGSEDDANAKNYEFVGGDAIYEDINHDGNINELDIVYLGSSLPKLNGGFGVRMSWGRLSWNNQFNFRWGNRIVNGSRMNAECMYNTDNTSAAINWRWRVEGDKTVMPRALYQYGYNYLGSDRYVEDGSFLRWNYTALSYSLDPTLTKKIGLGNVSFNLNLNNVHCWTKYSGMDPEVGSGQGSVAMDNAQTPRSKQVTFGLSVQF